MKKIYHVIFILVFFMSCDKQIEAFYNTSLLNNEQKKIKNIIDNVSNWTEQNLKNSDGVNGWTTSTFYIGIIEIYKQTNDIKYFKRALSWSKSNNWKIKNRYRNADDQACGQVYLEIYELENNVSYIDDIKKSIDEMIDNPLSGREDWY